MGTNDTEKLKVVLNNFLLQPLPVRLAFRNLMLLRPEDKPSKDVPLVEEDQVREHSN